MSGDSRLVILLVGLWLAGQIVSGTGFGLVADLCIGAFIGAWLRVDFVSPVHGHITRR